jgi:hypothetical protein
MAMPADWNDLPGDVSINAWTGEDGEAQGGLIDNTKPWAIQPPPKSKQAMAGHIPDLRNWSDPEVGWGLLMLHRPDVSAADNANLKGMPDAISELVKFRHGVVLGWSAENGTDSLIRYLPDNTTEQVVIGDVKRGTATPDALPRYILILGPPSGIPWLVQYALNLCAAVGRLDLDEAGLRNYVSAVINEWKDTPLNLPKCVLWSVDRGGTDITALMKTTVADPLLKELRKDPQIGDNAQLLTGQDATHAKLRDALSGATPGLVVTTSHGKTGPLNDPVAMQRDLGLLVDRTNATLPVVDLLNAWQPNGAIWYAHACCSAGCDTGSVFADLFRPAPLARTLDSIGKLGAQSAPLPRALLGAAKPLRAFIGHVEPTFDWTLTGADMRQALTASIVAALYQNLYEENPMTVGGAFGGYFTQVGNLFNQQSNTLLEVQRFVDGAERKALRYRLGALDRRSLVIHGDPAVALPALP